MPDLVKKPIDWEQYTQLYPEFCGWLKRLGVQRYVRDIVPESRTPFLNVHYTVYLRVPSRSYYEVVRDLATYGEPLHSAIDPEIYVDDELHYTIIISHTFAHPRAEEIMEKNIEFEKKREKSRSRLGSAGRRRI